MKIKRNKQAGFTILELLVATTVFSVILLIMTFAILQIGRIYYKGTTNQVTQDTARNIIDEVARDIQFSGGTPILQWAPAPGVSGYYCIGNHKYSYVLDKQLDPNPTGTQTRHGLIVDEVPCTSAMTTPELTDPILSPTARELLGFRMRINNFFIEDKGNGLYQITLRIVYGDDDLLDGTHTRCNSGPGSAFCATSELSTTVKKRIK